MRRLVGSSLREGDLFELIPIDLSPHRDRWQWGDHTSTSIRSTSWGDTCSLVTWLTRPFLVGLAHGLRSCQLAMADVSDWQSP